MTPSPDKKAWATPNVERFGSFAEVTRQPEGKFAGTFDHSAHEDDCPTGPYNQGRCIS